MSRCGFRIDVDGSPVYVCGQADMSDEDMGALMELVKVAREKMEGLTPEEWEALLAKQRHRAQRRR